MDCVEHTQKGDAGGYGTTRYKGVNIKLHRLAYCEHHNIQPSDIAGVVIRHTCDNPKCINPMHLLEGTHQDNMADKVHRGRSAKGVENGNSKLTPEDIIKIRELYVRGSRTLGGASLGRMFGVHKTAILDIIKGRTWR